jgi:hypothetical protein
VGLLKAAPRPLRHPSLAALLEDPINSSSIVSPGIAAHARLSCCGGGATFSAPGSSAACRASSSSSSSGVMVQAAGAGCSSARGKGLSVMVNGVAVSVPGASHVPLPKWLLGQEDEEQSAEGGQLLLMMVGDQNLANLRRSMDQQVRGGTDVICKLQDWRKGCSCCTAAIVNQVLRAMGTAGGTAAHIVSHSTTCTLQDAHCSAFVTSLGAHSSGFCIAAARSCAATARLLW